MDGDVSIHAPPKGRDRRSYYLCVVCRRFNPRAPEGARLILFCEFPYRSTVSIHAPPKGRDVVNQDIKMKYPVSIHAPPKGRDQVARVHCHRIPMFQSTRPRRGATKILLTGSARVCLFQSTRPRRGATKSQRLNTNETKFQSTRPRRGATG